MWPLVLRAPSTWRSPGLDAALGTPEDRLNKMDSRVRPLAAIALAALALALASCGGGGGGGGGGAKAAVREALKREEIRVKSIAGSDGPGRLTVTKEDDTELLLDVTKEGSSWVIKDCTPGARPASCDTVPTGQPLRRQSD